MFFSVFFFCNFAVYIVSSIISYLHSTTVCVPVFLHQTFSVSGLSFVVSFFCVNIWYGWVQWAVLSSFCIDVGQNATLWAHLRPWIKKKKKLHWSVLCLLRGVGGFLRTLGICWPFHRFMLTDISCAQQSSFSLSVLHMEMQQKTHEIRCAVSPMCTDPALTRSLIAIAEKEKKETRCVELRFNATSEVKATSAGRLKK